MITVPPRQLAPYFRIRHSTVTISDVLGVMAQADANRVMVRFTLNVALPIGFMTISPFPTTNIRDGWLFSGSGAIVGGSAVVTYTYSDFGPIVGEAWYGLADPGLSSPILVTELRYDPYPRGISNDAIIDANRVRRDFSHAYRSLRREQEGADYREPDRQRFTSGDRARAGFRVGRSRGRNHG